MENIFYTYWWLRADATPYYVGKGKGRRAFEIRGHALKRPKYRSRIFVQYWESEEKAFEMEKWYINFFGRKDLGTGILRNQTDGGEGISNLSEKTLEKKRVIKKKQWDDPEFRIKLEASIRGRKYSPEGIEGRRKAQNKLWEDPLYVEMQSKAHNRPWTEKRRQAFILGQKNPKPKRMADCHPDRKRVGNGLCSKCYEKIRWIKRKEKEKAKGETQ